MKETWKLLQLFGEEQPEAPQEAPAAEGAAEQEQMPVQEEASEREERPADEKQTVFRGADRIYEGWIRESEQLKQLYPGFDLQAEMRNPVFLRLLGSRVDMQTAFEVIHNREIIPAAMEYAAHRVEQHLAKAMRTAAERPMENGIRSQGAVMLGSDVSHMSRQEYDRVCAMVQRGERVSFG